LKRRRKWKRAGTWEERKRGLVLVAREGSSATCQLVRESEAW